MLRKSASVGFVVFVVLLTTALLAMGKGAMVARANPSYQSGSEFPQPTIAPDIQRQQAGSWCGPAVLQAAIQWVNTYPDRTPVPGVAPTSVPQADLWAYMRDHDCSELGGGDTYLRGKPVGDGEAEVRKLNISYDFGVDPHALAWTMWIKTPPGYSYHYYVSTKNVYDATKKLLYSLEKYHEPVLAAVWYGSHWVLVTGYKSQNPAYPSGDPGTIYQIKVADPSSGQVFWYTYSDWASYWFTQYTDAMDPDPATGCYVPPPDHWKNHWVSVERDSIFYLNADWALADNGEINRHCTALQP